MTQRLDLPGAKNVQMLVTGSILYLYCDLSKDHGASGSGKSILISSSSGNKPLGKSGAFLGLNIFTKSLDKRDLSNAGLGELCSAEFTAVGDGCQWRMEEDGKTLCMKIDFDTVKARPGASGKSILLATTGGNKPIASSGLSCGLNCYHPVSTTFAVEQLAVGTSPEEELQVGQSTDLSGGFTVVYAAANQISLRYTYRTEDMADGHVASMPAFRLGDVTTSLFVAAVKAARPRKESASASPPQSQGTTGTNGAFLQEDGKADKVRNVVVRCTPSAAGASPDAYDVELTFDPTACYGRSSSGKSMTVASTGGFQRIVDVEGRVVCRVSLNSYRPAPPITRSEITAAVAKVLSAKPKTEVAGLSFKDVLAEVITELGAAEAMKEALRLQVKEEVGAFLKSTA